MGEAPGCPCIWEGGEGGWMCLCLGAWHGAVECFQQILGQRLTQAAALMAGFGLGLVHGLVNSKQGRPPCLPAQYNQESGRVRPSTEARLPSSLDEDDGQQ
jgi:hypothetical protein